MADRSELASSSCPSPSSLAHDVITVFQFHSYAVEHNITDMEQHLLDLAKESKIQFWVDRLLNWNGNMLNFPLCPKQSHSQRPWAVGTQNVPLRNYRKCPSPLSSPAPKPCGPWLGCWPPMTPTWARPPVPSSPPLPRTNPSGQRSVVRTPDCVAHYCGYFIGLFNWFLVSYRLWIVTHKDCQKRGHTNQKMHVLLWAAYRSVWDVDFIAYDGGDLFMIGLTSLASSLGLLLGCGEHRRRGVTVWLDWWRTSSGRHRNPPHFW